MTRARLAAGLLLVLLVAGCIDAGPPGCETLPMRIELALTADALVPPDPVACRDSNVTLVVTSAVDGVFHIHGYDAEVPATSVTAGEVTELVFTAARSGQFPIELHTDEHTEGVSLGILTVREP